MATLGTVIEVVLGFAKTNTFTSSPDTAESVIVPAPRAMNDVVFPEFFGALAKAVGNGGIVCNLEVQCVKDSVKWIDVANCVFFNQTGANG